MSLSKKHYEAIASIIASNEFNHLVSGGNAIVALADSLANYFETDNPRFNRERFLKACGIEESQT